MRVLSKQSCFEYRRTGFFYRVCFKGVGEAKKFNGADLVVIINQRSEFLYEKECDPFCCRLFKGGLSVVIPDIDGRYR